MTMILPWQTRVLVSLLLSAKIPKQTSVPRDAVLPACARKCQIPACLTPSRVREYMMKGDEENWCLAHDALREAANEM
jgi:hypothetical protein